MLVITSSSGKLAPNLTNVSGFLLPTVFWWPGTHQGLILYVDEELETLCNNCELPSTWHKCLNSCLTIDEEVNIASKYW